MKTQYTSDVHTGTTSKYISLEANSGNCDTVGTFLYTEQFVSQNGVWEGTSTFNYNVAKYLINFGAFGGTNYTDYINYIFGKLLGFLTCTYIAYLFSLMNTI